MLLVRCGPDAVKPGQVSIPVSRVELWINPKVGPGPADECQVSTYSGHFTLTARRPVLAGRRRSALRSCNAVKRTRPDTAATDPGADAMLDAMTSLL